MIAAIALVYFTPLRQIVTDAIAQAKPENTMSAQTLNELAENIEEDMAARTRADILQQIRVQDEMDQILRQVASQYTQFQASQRDQSARDAVEEMTAALDELRQAKQAIEAGQPIAEIDSHQAKAQHAQDRATTKLSMVPFEADAVRDLHKQAVGQHLEAKEHNNVANEYESASQRQRLSRQENQDRLDKRREELKEQEAREKPSEGAINRAKNDIEKIEQQIAKTDEQIDQLQARKAEAHQSHRGPGKGHRGP